MSTEIPKIIADREESGTVRFWCAYCKKHHVHGCFGVKTSPCHRENSPYFEKDYELVERPKLVFERLPQEGA